MTSHQLWDLLSGGPGTTLLRKLKSKRYPTDVTSTQTWKPSNLWWHIWTKTGSKPISWTTYGQCAKLRTQLKAVVEPMRITERLCLTYSARFQLFISLFFSYSMIANTSLNTAPLMLLSLKVLLFLLSRYGTTSKQTEAQNARHLPSSFLSGCSALLKKYAKIL